MEKINFQDLPSTNTPIDSDNLNQMQDNMEDAIVPIKLVSISDTAPASATIGDMYYNTTDNKVYTATGTNTWDSGTTPRYDGFYINTNDNTLFYYNGSTLIGVGGSQTSINVKNEETTSETDVYSCNYINKLPYTLSNTETETGRTISYNNQLYKEYVRLYEIDMVGTSNVNTNHNLTNFLLTKIEATEWNPTTNTQFPLPSYRPTFPSNGIGLYISNTQIVIEAATEAPDRTGHIALVSLYYIKLNSPLSNLSINN